MPNAEMMHTAAITTYLLILPIQKLLKLFLALKYVFFDEKQVYFYN